MAACSPRTSEWEDERDAADEIKQHKEILVILGNPPYNGYAGVALEEERELSNASYSNTPPSLTYNPFSSPFILWSRKGR